MNVTQDDVTAILRIMDESRFQELHLEMGDLKIVVNKRDGRIPTEKADPAAGVAPDARAASGSVTTSRAETGVSSTTPPAGLKNESPPSAGEEIMDEGLIPINSPMLGTFYTAPKPGEPPFVAVGSMVKEETTVCIIEVMKLFSTINAGISGRIVKICAEDGQLVEHGQVLFVIEPESD